MSSQPIALTCREGATGGGAVLADATVVIALRRSDGSRTTGTVQLTRGAETHRCTTDAEGRCEIRGVAGGAYTVTVRQGERAAQKPRTVMIPPTGEVKLIVNAT